MMEFRQTKETESPKIICEKNVAKRNSQKLKHPIATFENTSNICMAKAIVELSKVGHKLDEPDENDEESRTDEAAITCSTCCQCHSVEAPTPRVLLTTGEDWQADLVTPLQRLSQLFSLGHLSDVTITFANSSEVYQAHRLILATASPVFEAMFYGNTKEARTGQVCLHCVPSAMKWVLENLYLGTSDLVSVVNAILVFELAQMYNMSGITSLCRDYLKYEVSMNNVTDIFDVAKTHSEDSLLTACVKKLCTAWDEMLNENIHQITEEMWVYLLQTSFLAMPEVQLFKGLHLWIKRQLENDGQPESPKKIRQELEKFLPNMRLFSIPTDIFIDHVMPTNVFTPEECSNILLKLRGFHTPLPDSVKCSPIPYSRIKMTDDTVRIVVLNRMSDSRKTHPGVLTDMTLIKNFTVNNPVLLHQIQTQDNATLKHAQLHITDSDGRQVGFARALGSQWKFVAPTFLYANKSYTVTIDKVLATKAFQRKDFCTYASDVKFKGTTGDNYIKVLFWPAQIKYS